jgi:predicted DNA-binding transcriptional regulator AlpA
MENQLTPSQWLAGHPGLMNTAQLAQLLGISEQGAYKLSRENRLPGGIRRMKIGRVVRYKIADVAALLTAQNGGDSDAE